MPGKFQTLISTRYLRPYVGRHRAIDIAATVAFGRRAAAFTGGLTASFVGAFASPAADSAPESLPAAAPSSPAAPDQTVN